MWEKRNEKRREGAEKRCHEVRFTIQGNKRIRGDEEMKSWRSAAQIGEAEVQAGGRQTKDARKRK